MASADGTTPASIDEAMTFLLNCSVTRGAKKGIDENLAFVEAHAQRQGLTERQILALLPAILDEIHYIGTRKRLIKALIPQGQVPEAAVVQIISRFNHISTPRVLVAPWMQWILMVLPVLDSTAKLHNLYGVLFFWLDYETIRPILCNLLYILTRRQDVKPFRVRRLLALQKTVGSEPALIALLSCYKLFAPQQVTLVLSGGRRRWFPPLDDKWVATMERVQAAHRRSHPGSGDGEGAGMRDVSGSLLRREISLALPQLKAGIRSYSGVPALQTAATAGGPSRPGLEQMASIEEVARNLDTLELPAQLAAVLHNKHLQHVVSCMPDQSTLHRLAYWLSVRLTEDPALLSGAVSEGVGELLASLVSFAEFMDETLPIVDNFLTPFLRRWNGVDYREHVLRLVQLMPPQPYESLYRTILRPLNNILTSGNAACQRDIIACFTGILRRFATYDWQLHYTRETEGESEKTASFSHVLSQPLAHADYIRTLRELLSFVDSVTAVALQVSPNDLLLQDAVLSFYELSSQLCREHRLPLVSIPSAGVVYPCVLGSSAQALSRMCGVLTQNSHDYKQFCEQADALAAGKLPFKSTVENIEVFNSYIMDLVNALWRNRTLAPNSQDLSCLMHASSAQRRAAGDSGDEKDLGPDERAALSGLRESFRSQVLACLQPLDLSEEEMLEALSITQNWCCANFAHAFLEKKRDLIADELGGSTAIQLKPSMIRKGWRVAFIDYLAEEKHMTGLKDFLYAFISSLKARSAKPQVAHEGETV